MARRKYGTSTRKLVLPTWVAADHPLHLNSIIRQRIRREYDPRAIFLNIPYSRRYSNLEIAIIATVTAYGLLPRMARERARIEIRLLKIVELMLSSGFGLTDLSYVMRMNMPFELGLLLAFGKESLVMSGKRYGALRTISDLNFTDIHYHEGCVGRLIEGLSLWIEQVYSSKRLSTETLLKRYRRLRRLRKALGSDFDRLRPSEIALLLGAAEDEFKLIL